MPSQDSEPSNSETDAESGGAPTRKRYGSATTGSTSPWWAGLIDKLGKRTGATKEAGTDYDGFLSYSTEFHALGVGFTAGFTVEASMPVELKAAIASALGIEQTGGKKLLEHNKILREVREEPLYFLLGIGIGAVAGFVHQHGVTEAAGSLL